MKTTILAAAVSFGTLTSCVSALVTIGISKSSEPPLRARLNSRATITESLINNVTGGDYVAMVTVGGQALTLAIDTGSSDVWVMSNTADLCTSVALQTKYQTGGCGTTYSSGAKGDYISDTLTIGGTSITALEMGLAHNATLRTGLLGIGYDVNEASNNPKTQASPFVYSSIIDTMVTEGLINTRAYSLYLDDLQSSTGSIIFGGMDTDKFTGSLYQLPVVPQQYSNGTTIYAELAVEMTSFGMTDESGTTTSVTSTAFDIPAVLDSGTTITYLPSTPVAKLYALINAVDDTSNSGEVYVDCNLRSQTSTTFNYGFGGSGGVPATTIKVPVSELIFDLGGAFTANNAPTNLPFTDVCAFGIQTLGDTEPFILGDTFLRSAYVVYDLKNNVIALAQTNFNSTDSNMVEFEATQTGIPSASGAASAASVTQTATNGLGGLGNPKTTSATGSGTAATVTITSTAGVRSGAASATKNAAAGNVPPFDLSKVVVMGISSICVLLGGAFLGV